MRLGRVSDCECQSRPRAGRVERTLIVPRTKQAKNFAAERACKKPVYLIEPPNKMSGDFAEDFAAQIPLEVCVGPAALVPRILCRHGAFNLVSQERCKRKKE